MVSVSTFLQRWAANAQGSGFAPLNFFGASALSILKAQTSSSSVSRVNVVTAVIWKCFMEAVAEESVGKDVKPVLMTQAVNLRRKATPPFPDDRSDGVYEFLEELRNEMPQEATWLAFTSWSNIGLSEVNFGWGKPVWMSGYIPQYSEYETLVGSNVVILLDLESGGIEASAILNKKYVAGFEKNDHICKYARFNPSVI
ncbi:hypothetical protein SASPL_149939 [Salvia splendens]|uniref:Uncharacterized protein n=1 Tax=Salvia splendens TaxID=180675 RepID=A0A8X8Z1K0_SALSN|nr:hypothetical protein SASPL_149939 [Salvia splendens]